MMSPIQNYNDFKKWFGNSVVVDGDEKPLVVYHATRDEFTAFAPQNKSDTGFHFGTVEQARMRGGRNATLLKVYLKAEKLKRCRDKGSWTKAQIASARREGYDGIVYLNRYEGMTAERVALLHEQRLLDKLDRMSDREFRKVVPEAQDSFIVFEPTQVKSIYNRTWSLTDPCFDDGSPLPELPEETEGGPAPRL